MTRCAVQFIELALSAFKGAAEPSAPKSCMLISTSAMRPTLVLPCGKSTELDSKSILILWLSQGYVSDCRAPSRLDREGVCQRRRPVSQRRVIFARMSNPFRHLKTSPEIILLAVMMYIRSPLSLCNMADLLHRRGIDISHETVTPGKARLSYAGASPTGH